MWRLTPRSGKLAFGFNVLLSNAPGEKTLQRHGRMSST